MVCFSHFDFEMCFAPQLHALFQHLNFQKSLRHWGVLRILTTKCGSRHKGVHFFNISISKRGLRPSIFYLLTFIRASPHNGVQFFNILISKSAPNLVWFAYFDFEMRFAPQRRSFSLLISPDGPTPAALASLFFDPPDSVSRLFYVSTRLHLLPLTLSLLWSSLFCSSLFYSSLLSDSSHLCFSSVHIVGSLTSKLPSVMYTWWQKILN